MNSVAGSTYPHSYQLDVLVAVSYSHWHYHPLKPVYPYSLLCTSSVKTEIDGQEAFLLCQHSQEIAIGGGVRQNAVKTQVIDPNQMSIASCR